MASNTDLVTDSTEELEKKQTFKEMTAKERFNFIREVITVEPLILFIMVPTMMCVPGYINLEYEKSCITKYGFNETVCEAIIAGRNQNYTEQNRLVQEHLANLHSWMVPISSIGPLIALLFYGSYSDRHQVRKPFLIIPIIGHLFSLMGGIISVIFMRELEVEVLAIFNSVVTVFSGGDAIFFIMIFAYIADVSSMEMRTLRIGVTQMVLGVSMPLTQSFSASLFKALGYFGLYAIAGVLYLFGLLYVIFRLEESRKPIIDDDKKKLIVDLFNPRHVKSTFELFVKEAPGNNRTFMVMLIVVLVLTHGAFIGELSVFYFYAQVVFNWDIVKFFYFITFATVVHLIGTLIGVPLFTKVFKLSDYSIIIIGALDKIVGNLIMAFAKTPVVFCIAVCASIFSHIAQTGMRSLSTKIVSENDLGKAQALFGIFESVGGAIAAPAYNQSYKVLVHTFPGAYFLFGIVLYGIGVIIILWMQYLDKNLQKKNLTEDAKCEKSGKMDISLKEKQVPTDKSL